MTTKFNNGKAYHGSNAITNGKLQGTTDTDYFYFFCPACEGKQIMRLLDYEVRQEQPNNPYNDHLKSKAIKGFTLAFKLHCEKCNLTDFVKLSNLGWQSGDFEARVKPAKPCIRSDLREKPSRPLTSTLGVTILQIH